MKSELHAVTLDEARAARERIAKIAVRTPLLRLNIDGPREIYLKLETLQPIGSFKLRGAANAIAMADKSTLESGVYTASAGNMAQGVAWCARELGIRCRVIVPEHAPRAKTDAVERLGGEIIKVPFEKWWQIVIDHGAPGMDGLFIHPFADNAVMAGNGTIALEIFEDLGDIDTIVVPYGGGGLSCGIASVTRALSAHARVYGAEVETAAPLKSSLTAGAPVSTDYTRTFVDGIGSAALFDEMWPLVKSLLAGSVVVSLEEIASAVKLLVERSRVVAEGAGAAAVAAALSGQLDAKRIVCIVSGGNIDAEKLATILGGGIP